ncbi:MAG: phosphotransferase [Chloroflexi bacterium]|nr:phosphotransferase [Chloroflexota bacterium]
MPVNDVAAVTARQGRFALKLYNTRTRTAAEVQWETDLIRHLLRHGVPVVAPIDEQLERMRRHLVQAGRWPEMVALAERLKQRIDDPALDRGVCHMDLSLSNIRRSGDRAIAC